MSFNKTTTILTPKSTTAATSDVSAQWMPIMDDLFYFIYDVANYWYWRKRKHDGTELPRLDPDDDRFIDESILTEEQANVKINEEFLKNLDKESEVYKMYRAQQGQENLNYIVSQWDKVSDAEELYLKKVSFKELVDVEITYYVNKQGRVVTVCLENVKKGKESIVKKMLNGLEIRGERRKCCVINEKGGRKKN
ncbi:hypothetical protein WICPIJ_007575 [Wickerhamomyces pijperi]|uniref:Uncharacterized protein n=1 Tax=Wickerhamomyces pijperi TaxID=599730 RepID=A0A9P8TJU4_WICPI|nr:hypothetical protein WICPIJ_007575 [Wickerhamomyces pijperi]